MRKIFILVIVGILLVSPGCTYNNTQERLSNNQDVQPEESSIFQVDDVKNCRITANVANVKAGPGQDFNEIGSLSKNDIVKVLGQVENWYIVMLDNFQVGAIDSNNAEPIVVDGQNQQNEPNKEPQIVQQPQQPEQSPQNQQEQFPQNEENTEVPSNQLVGLSTEEQQMVNLINQERRKNSLPDLQVDLELARVAEIKSQDMVDNNYFSHNSPNYGSPFDMMKSFGIEYLVAGENLAGNSTVERAHNALMNSSGHRKNILHPDFTHVGIGAKPSSKYGNMYTQMFIGK